MKAPPGAVCVICGSAHVNTQIIAQCKAEPSQVRTLYTCSKRERSCFVALTQPSIGRGLNIPGEKPGAWVWEEIRRVELETKP